MLLLPFRASGRPARFALHTHLTQSIQRRITHQHRKTHASRLPIEKRLTSVNPSGTLRYYALIKMPPSPPLHPTPPLPFTHMPCGLSWAIIGMFGMHTSHLARSHSFRLPFIPDAISNGCVCGPVERRWPGHPRLLQSRSVARIHGVGALHVPVVVSVGVGVAPVFDFDRGAGLSPEMLRRLQSRLSFPGNRERQGQALLRAWWWFHHSAKNKIKIPLSLVQTY